MKNLKEQLSMLNVKCQMLNVKYSMFIMQLFPMEKIMLIIYAIIIKVEGNLYFLQKYISEFVKYYFMYVKYLYRDPDYFSGIRDRMYNGQESLCNGPGSLSQ